MSRRPIRYTVTIYSLLTVDGYAYTHDACKMPVSCVRYHGKSCDSEANINSAAYENSRENPKPRNRNDAKAKLTHSLWVQFVHDSGNIFSVFFKILNYSPYKLKRSKHSLRSQESEQRITRNAFLNKVI